MGQVGFSTDCAPTDQACLSAGLHAPIARGATLRVDVALTYAGTAALGFELQPVDPKILKTAGNTLTGVEQGIVALLVVAPGERLVDFIHVSVQAPSRIGFHLLGPQGGDMGQLEDRVELLAGDRVVLDVRPYDQDRLLLGEVDASWSASDDGVTLLDPGLGSRREILARKPGKTRITVTSAGHTAHIDLVVLP